MKRGNRTMQPVASLILAAVAASSTLSAGATVWSWNRGLGSTSGTGTNNFDSTQNWVGAVAPPVVAAEGDVTDLLYTGTSAKTGGQNLRQSYVVNSLTFAADFIGAYTNPAPGVIAPATFNINNTTLLAGNTSADLTIGAGGITSHVTGFNIGINWAPASVASGTARLILGADQTWTTNAPLLPSGSVAINLQRQISGGFRITKAGTGLLILAPGSANTEWTGGMTLVEGSVRTGGAEGNHSGQFGTGSISHESDKSAGITASTVSTLGGGASGGGGGNRFFDNDLVLGGTGTFTTGGSFEVNFTANSQWTLTAQKNFGTGTITRHAGSIDGAFGFNKLGGGMLVLQSANTYTGPTNVNEGVLRLANSFALGLTSDPVSVAAFDGVTNLVGGQLELDGGLIIAGKALSIAGNGNNAATPFAGVETFRGALRNRVGINTWTNLVTVAGSATIYLDEGTLNLPAGIWGTVAAAGLTISKGGVPTVTVNTAKIDLAGPVQLDAGVVVNIAADGTAAGTSRATALAFGDATSVLNLADNDLIIDYTDPSPIASIIAAAQAGNLLANGDAAGLPTYLAIAEAADLGLTEYNGFTIDETTVIAKFTYVGDANLDGQVDALDYERVDLAIGNSGVFGTAQGDLNYDGTVDALDYEQIDLNIGNGVGSPLAQIIVPEPTSLSLLALSFVGLTRRRR
jgi:autotransporter-associated beta strand protein